jgi:hypothetical protein
MFFPLSSEFKKASAKPGMKGMRFSEHHYSSAVSEGTGKCILLEVILS